MHCLSSFKFEEKWHSTKFFLNQHTDTLSSISILAVTTGLLASKIFPNMPSIIGKSGRLFLEFGGIIWLNVQFNEFFKSNREFTIATKSLNGHEIFRTTLKVITKGMNILLTCAYFSASVTTFSGFPQVSLAIYLSLRPLSLAILCTEIANDVWDYKANQKLLEQLDAIENTTLPRSQKISQDTSRQIAKIMCCYLKIINQQKISASELKTSEGMIASALVRQLDTFTIEHLKKNLNCADSPRVSALKLYFNIKEGLINTQSRVESNLSLTALGYASRFVCKMYPDSLTEMVSRWVMSVLFTDELVIKYKLKQMNLV